MGAIAHSGALGGEVKDASPAIIKSHLFCNITSLF